MLFKNLLKLSTWLKRQGFTTEAQAIKDLSEPDQYEEDWHEEAVKEFGGQPISEEEYAAQNFGGGPEQLESIKDDVYIDDAEILQLVAEREGVQILHVGEDTSTLGSGMFGTVVSGVYKGKPVAAKIIFEGEAEEHNFDLDSDEGENWKKILQATKYSPPELKKHIPEIYHVNKDKFIMDDGMTCEYEIIIMEQLFPLNSNLSNLMQHKNYEPYANRLLKDEEYLYKIAQAITNYINKYKSRFKLDIPELTAIEIFNVILSLGKITYYHSERIVKAVINYLAKQYNLNKISRKGKDILFVDTERAGDLHASLYTVVAKFIRPEGMPVFQGEDTEFWEDVPETSTFYRNLKEMAENFGIKWMDVHFNNMMLDRDGNLKIVDVGAYNTINFTTSKRPTVTLPKNGNV